MIRRLGQRRSPSVVVARGIFTGSIRPPAQHVVSSPLCVFGDLAPMTSGESGPNGVYEKSPKKSAFALTENSTFF
jgi:hypothetical protein